MANPLEAGFSEDHRGKIRKPPRESVIRNIISPAIEEDRAHGSFQDYLDINKAHVLMLARQGIISEEVEKRSSRRLTEWPRWDRNRIFRSTLSLKTCISIWSAI